MEVEEIEDDFFATPSQPNPAPVQTVAKPRVGRRAAGGPTMSGGASMSMLGDEERFGTESQPHANKSGFMPSAPSQQSAGYQPSAAKSCQPEDEPGGQDEAGSSYRPGGNNVGGAGRRRRNFLLGGVQAKDAAPNSMLPAEPAKQEEPSAYQPSAYRPSAIPQQPPDPLPPQKEVGHQPTFHEQPGEEEHGHMPSMGRHGQHSATQPSHAPQEPAQPPPVMQPAAAPPQQGPSASKPSGGFKFKFGAKMSHTPERQPSPEPALPPVQLPSQPEPQKAAHRPPSSANSYTPPESREGGSKPMHAMVSGPSGAGAHGARNASPGPGPAGSSAAVNVSKESVLSDQSASKAAVHKSDRLRALEDELAALSVTAKLDHAYLDDKGRDMKPKPKKKKAELEEMQARVDTGLGNDADASARHELLKAYQQVKRYQIENEKLKEQLDTCMNAYDEIAKLKNMVAEKVQVISVLEKERGALHKLHRQYQKERLDQDAIESQYGERVRRVNEELRVAKAKLHKYKEIHGELEGSLGKAQDKVRQLEDKNRELRQKLTAITGNSKVPVDPDKVKQRLADKDEAIRKLEHDKEVLQRVADAASKRLEAKDRQRVQGRQEAEEQSAELRRQLEDKTRALKETQALLHRQQSRMQRLKQEHGKLRDLNKDRLKLERILDEPLPGQHDDSLFLAGIDPISRSSSVNSIRSAGSAKPPSKLPADVRHFNAEGDRVPHMGFQAAPKKDSGGSKRWKPESPAEMAAYFDKNKEHEGGTAYMSLLSPQAKSALEEARTWRSTASKGQSVTASPLRSPVGMQPGRGAAGMGVDSGGLSLLGKEGAIDEDATSEPPTSDVGRPVEGRKEGGQIEEEVAEMADDDAEEYGEYNDDFEDVDVEELSRRSSRASKRGEAAPDPIPSYSKAASGRSLARAGRAEPASVPVVDAGDLSVDGVEVDDEEVVDEEVESAGGFDDVEQEDMDMLLAGLTNDQGPPAGGDGTGLPKLSVRQTSDVKSGGPSSTRSKGSKASSGKDSGPGKTLLKQHSTKQTPRSKPAAPSRR